ncbi:C2 and GRAM domain-containing protein At1g03370 isoform X2 [Physcomitrium patens]|uniref:C2 and GRAM domain-containing protein At1g03370 isoform X2 n=1 Tax=Physcomitrium patens TaxID=3218 RepID=UPI000D16D3F0|nr:C2 and GRAM domain-containing protein At1g03370-like isoform X2 [Physcomitrium patens]|eukprot:XP_024372049.1 C2 and GRAM domain-containing protein At1g03370-like isoform X2 [Physcomitrella patens]
MKLHVHVLEARNLAARDQNGLSDPFVRLQLGNTKTKSAVILKNLNPVWHEEFFFSVVGSDEELLVTVWDEDRFLNDFLGQVKIPVSEILTAEKQTITRKWYTLQKRSEKSKILITGEILLSLSLFGRDSATGRRPQRFVSEERHSVSEDGTYTLSPTSSIDMNDCLTDTSGLVDVPGSPSLRATWPGAAQWNHDEVLSKEQNKVPKSLADRFTAVFNKKCKTGMDGASKHGVEGSTSSTPKFSDSAHVESPDRFPEVAEDCSDDEIDTLASSFFDDDGKSMEPSVDDFPPPLASGVVLDQRYGTSAKSLSALICKAGSPFIQELLTCLKTTEYSEEPWKRANNGCIERVVSYMKAATKIIKAVKASESHTCRRLDDRGFILDISCSTPDVPYGSNFMVKLQFCILAGQDLPSQEKTCRLQVSWTLHFLHSTMMKGMIENGARAGIKETYELYREVLSRYAKPIYEGPPGRELVPEAKREEETPLSDWELVKGYFGKLHVLMAILSLTAVFLHIGFASPKASATLIRWGFDLPDSLSEFLFSAIVVLQVEKVVKMVHQFLQARYWQSGDHGVKAQGDGWLMTVTLIEGENLSPTEECSFSNPYAVFTCSGKRRTSSVKLRTLNPRWREVFEFDATEDPPSTMDVEVFDYDGPFSDAESLGHAEINFLKQSPEDLADFWISLSGKCARTHGSRLHLRVFLTNTKQSDALPEYLERVQKEGIKVVKRSAQKNGSFQKLFALPAEEFLINDFACAIKKKILIQGRLFLSPRMLGFYSNLFGIKTKFQFIWEDIDDIVETPVAINPCIVMFLRKGRGLDARNGMRGIDAHGRAKFYFCSFVKPVTAFRFSFTLRVSKIKVSTSPEQSPLCGRTGS